VNYLAPQNANQWPNYNEIQSDRMVHFSLDRERDQQRQAIHKAAITNVAVSRSVFHAGGKQQFDLSPASAELPTVLSKMQDTKKNVDFFDSMKR
jgi:hypothetical protein